MSTNPPKPRTTTGDHLRAVETTEQAPLEREPARAADVEDPALMPQLLRLVAGELRELGAAVRERVVPALGRLAEAAAEDRSYTDQQFQRLHARIDELTARIAAGAR